MTTKERIVLCLLAIAMVPLLIPAVLFLIVFVVGVCLVGVVLEAFEP